MGFEGPFLRDFFELVLGLLTLPLALSAVKGLYTDGCLEDGWTKHEISLATNRSTERYDIGRTNSGLVDHIGFSSQFDPEKEGVRESPSKQFEHHVWLRTSVTSSAPIITITHQRALRESEVC